MSEKIHLEEFAHLRQSMCALWGTAEFDAWARSILMDTRDGARRGLPMEAARELLFLQRLNREVRALEAQERLGVDWESARSLVEQADARSACASPWMDPSFSAGSGKLGRSGEREAQLEEQARRRAPRPAPKAKACGIGVWALLKAAAFLAAAGFAAKFLKGFIF